MKIRVIGLPIPQGSKRAFVNPQTGKAIITEAGGQKHKDWRREVKAAAMAAASSDGGWPAQKHVPIAIEIIFAFPRPQSHYNAAGVLMDQTYVTPAPFWHAQIPDIDKLMRAVLDSLTHVCYRDDAQVATALLQKVWVNEGEVPGATINVNRIEAGGQLT